MGMTRTYAILLMGALLVFAGCEDPRGSGEQTSRLTVYAASSLTDAFREIESGFEAAHPDVEVATNFAGSQVLRLQLKQGASADIFASANLQHMTALVDSGIIVSSEMFARNELAVVVPEDNPARIKSFQDLPRADSLVIGTDDVPVGRYTRQMFEHARAQLGDEFVQMVRDRVVSKESNVRLVRAKVAMGEADAAIVYRTDAVSSDRVKTVDVPSSINVSARYPIGLITATEQPELARTFVDYVRSARGAEVLQRHGFLSEAP